MSDQAKIVEPDPDREREPWEQAFGPFLLAWFDGDHDEDLPGYIEAFEAGWKAALEGGGND